MTHTYNITTNGMNATRDYGVTKFVWYDGLLYCGTRGFTAQAPSVMVSADNGLTWSVSRTFSEVEYSGNYISGMAVLGSDLFVAVGANAYIWKFDGATWSNTAGIRLGGATGNPSQCYDMVTYDNTLYWSGAAIGDATYWYLVYKSTDGITWTYDLRVTKASNKGIAGMAIAVYGSDLFVGAQWSNITNGGQIYKKSSGSWDAGTGKVDSQYLYKFQQYKGSLYLLGNSQTANSWDLYKYTGSWDAGNIQLTYIASTPAMFVSADGLLMITGPDHTVLGKNWAQMYYSSDGSTFTDLEDYSNITDGGVRFRSGASIYNKDGRTLIGNDAKRPAEVVYTGQDFICDFSATPGYGQITLDTDFTDLTTGNPTTWSWAFGDTGTSALQNPSHSYVTADQFTVVLTVSNDGADDIETKTDYIKTFDVAFSGTPVSEQIPFNCTFTNESDGPITDYDWDFGDGSPHSTDENPVHEYTVVGVYDVTLTVSNGAANANLEKEDYIEALDPVPATDFTAEFIDILEVQFNDTSTESPTSWLWDFGDGVTSTEQNPSHIFAVGTYTVALTATNIYGSKTETKTDYIVISTQTLHQRVYITSSGELNDLNEYAVDFIEKELQVKSDSEVTDTSTQIKYSDALLIDSNIELDDYVTRCYSPENGKVILRWRYPENITKSLYRHKIYRKKKGFTMQMKHSNGTFFQLKEDAVAVKIYDEELTSGEFIDTYRLEAGQQYFYTSFLEDKSTGYAYADALTLNPVSKISVINRSERWTEDDVLKLLPHQWTTKDTYGTNRAVAQMLAFRNDYLRDFVNALNLNDAEKILGEVVSLFTPQWSGLDAQTKLGVDTLKRQIAMSQQATQWKASRQGIVKLIRWLTTWQISTSNIFSVEEAQDQEWFETYGPGFNGSITWDETYGYGEHPYPLYGPTDLNALGTTDELIVFIEIPNVAIALGTSDALAYSSYYQCTVLEDNKVNFSLTNTTGAYLMANQMNPRERFEILASTSSKLYVRERISTAETGNEYAVLTALDMQRLQALLDILPKMMLFNCRPVVKFI